MLAQAIAEWKVKVTVADLDRLIRLEEFLREDLKQSDGVTVIFNWTDEHGNPIKDCGKRGKQGKVT